MRTVPADPLRDAAQALLESVTMLDDQGRDTIQAWLRGIAAGTWDPTPATKQVVASLLHVLLLQDQQASRLRGALAAADTAPQSDEGEHGVRLMHGPNCEFCKGVARALIGREARKARLIPSPPLAAADGTTTPTEDQA